MQRTECLYGTVWAWHKSLNVSKLIFTLPLVCKPSFVMTTKHLPESKEKVNVTFYHSCSSKISSCVINGLKNHQNINSSSWYTVLGGLTAWQIWLINPLNWPMTHSTVWLKAENNNQNTSAPLLPASSLESQTLDFKAKQTQCKLKGILGSSNDHFISITHPVLGWLWE